MNAITERHVQAMWFDAHLRPPVLYTSDGAVVRVVSPGEWNLTAGPDFRNAVLEVGQSRQRVCGDVEVHISPRDWELHGHGNDPNYQNVIAHVTWKQGPVPSSLPKDSMSIWLGKYVLPSMIDGLKRIDITAYPYSQVCRWRLPCERRSRDDVDGVLRELKRLGMRRLLLKARRLQGLLCERPGKRRQVFYSELMSILGAGQNTAQFRRIAERVPIDELPADRESVGNALTCAAGFEEWTSGGRRPFNCPERRLSAMAEFIVGGVVDSLIDATTFDRAEMRKMVGLLYCGGRGVGKGRAGAVIANVVVPLALAEGRCGEDISWLPPEDISSPVRLIAHRMFGRDNNPAATYSGNGLVIQGMLQVIRGICPSVYPDCGRL